MDSILAFFVFFDQKFKYFVSGIRVEVIVSVGVRQWNAKKFGEYRNKSGCSAEGAASRKGLEVSLDDVIGKLNANANATLDVAKTLL